MRLRWYNYKQRFVWTFRSRHSGWWSSAICNCNKKYEKLSNTVHNFFFEINKTEKPKRPVWLILTICLKNEGTKLHSLRWPVWRPHDQCYFFLAFSKLSSLLFISSNYWHSTQACSIRDKWGPHWQFWKFFLLPATAKYSSQQLLNEMFMLNENKYTVLK